MTDLRCLSFSFSFHLSVSTAHRTPHTLSLVAVQQRTSHAPVAVRATKDHQPKVRKRRKRDCKAKLVRCVCCRHTHTHTHTISCGAFDRRLCVCFVQETLALRWSLAWSLAWRRRRREAEGGGRKPERERGRSPFVFPLLISHTHTPHTHSTHTNTRTQTYTPFLSLRFSHARS